MRHQNIIGSRIADYRVLSLLGAGGMGAVYRARDEGLNKIIALKLLPEGRLDDAEVVERFRREAQAAARLEHPNVVPVYRFGQSNGMYYIAMRFVDGESLADRISRKTRLDLIEALFITREVAKGLEAAHHASLVHRDIKPANIMISQRGEVLVADFGLAKGSSDEGKQGLTATGTILGTPDYMSPEQCEGLSDIDGRSDLFSVGLMLYAALTGRVPSFGTTPLQVIMHRVQNPIPPLESVVHDLPEDVAKLVADLLIRDRSQRIHSATELLNRIQGLAIVRHANFEGNFKLLEKPPATAEITVSPTDVTVVEAEDVTPPGLNIRAEPKKAAAPSKARLVGVSKARLVSRPVKATLVVNSGEEKKSEPAPEPTGSKSQTLLYIMIALFGVVTLCCCLGGMLADKPPG